MSWFCSVPKSKYIVLIKMKFLWWNIQVGVYVLFISSLLFIPWCPYLICGSKLSLHVIFLQAFSPTPYTAADLTCPHSTLYS